MMIDDDFGAYDDSADERFDLSGSSGDEAKTTAHNPKGNRQRLERLLEEREFSQELDSYDDYEDDLDSSYDDSFAHRYNQSSFDEDYV